jgi:riboflavin kinase/FMN adenylyltransferase
MKIIYRYNDVKEYLKNSVVIIGNFDGIHTAHQKIFKIATLIAQKNKYKSIVFTFNPHPKIFLKKQKKNTLISRNKEKKYSIFKHNISILIIEKFNKNISNINSNFFIKKVLISNLKAKIIIVGNNFKFGKNRLGNIFAMKKIATRNNIKLILIKNIILNNNICSSSLIRNFISKGKIENANIILKKRFSIHETILYGSKKGKKIKIPTINSTPSKYLIYPKIGVYLSIINISKNKSFLSATNIGYKPTFNQNKNNKNKFIIETYLFNFSKTLYKKKITLKFIQRIRSEKKFPTNERLLKQINSDLIYLHEYTKKNTNKL